MHMKEETLVPLWMTLYVFGNSNARRNFDIACVYLHRRRECVRQLKEKAQSSSSSPFGTWVAAIVSSNSTTVAQRLCNRNSTVSDRLYKVHSVNLVSSQTERRMLSL